MRDHGQSHTNKPRHEVNQQVESGNPVLGCAVALRQSAQRKVGEVVGHEDRPDGRYVTVAWGRDRLVDAHMPDELGSGFQHGDTVQDIPRSYIHESLGTGKVIDTEFLAGEELVVVKFDGTGEIRQVPYQRLRRVIDVAERYVSGLQEHPDDAKRLQLKCLAHALESWNDRSGALDRLPVDPLPHQVDIVHRIMSSDQTNWLIADDVGLGKTIEVGLLLAAKKRRRRNNRVLVVCPAALTRQWQEEMEDKFGEDYRIYGTDFNINQPSQWPLFDKVIVSIDRAKSDKHLPEFSGSGDWDTVVFDEAHHLSKQEHAATTLRYRLAEALRGKTDEFIFLTGTPHQGDVKRFVNLLSLLRPDLSARFAKVYTDPSVVGEVVLKNRKDTVTDQDGNFVFKGQTTYLVEAEVSTAMREFQRQLELYLKFGYAASEQGQGTRRAIGFVMTIYRKLASSSIAAIESALGRRRGRLIKESGGFESPIDLPEEFEAFQESFFDGEDGRDDLVDIADRVATSELGKQQFFDGEFDMLEVLLRSAKRARQDDLKIRNFLASIVEQVVSQDNKLLIFTEYRATQEYIVDALKQHYPSCGVAQINGGMDLREKRENIGQFNEASRFMVSTEAGGEGINLHRECHIMVNYDIPWNPRRLVQRAGRLYRYGQTQRVSVFNLVVDDSFDTRSLSMMLQRVNVIADAMCEVAETSSDLLRSEILGDLLEQLDIGKALASNTTMDIERSEQDLEEALRRAEVAKQQQDRLFSEVKGYTSSVPGQALSLSQADVLTFLDGMLPRIGAEIRQRFRGGRVLELELPNELVGQYAEFGNRRVVRVTADRDLSRSLNGVEQMDFQSPFFNYLIEDAKSTEFGGTFAKISTRQAASFALYRLRWQNDQGVPSQESLLPVVAKGDSTDGFPDWEFFYNLLSGNELRPADAGTSAPPAATREDTIRSLSACADSELRRQRSNLRHPNGVILLAAAEIVRSVAQQR